ncbi:Wadjet anti-phage system protein JetD domain-containing protein [Sporolactobacillus terrae]|uniref:Wadjet protein JetD C-terminal domain-containing protein n=1 Tax=Sporolactobacillus terrae TaxID=269673 RepID=A0ABX5Q478_9BACL|nr:Wadjet anti-phage system protein JetD domain-containing protein [Sporolactobacillus terrae]QAA21442.1 hypothetical protein C0674_01700 [Sporolactobacillus terrae]QAA24414.1 hypothetical protein C0679_01680 [Sporolactobacillus terrae]UAK16240.1 DUF2220 domain-containing protein [Sporolactobacillus terrae]
MDDVTKRIATFAKKTITLDELQQLLNPFFSSYTDFAETVREFERHQVLVMIRASGRTIRIPALANRYRINKSALSGDYHKELQHYRSKLHQAISLDSYYRSDPELWARDLPDLIKVDHYLKNHGFPQEAVPAPERSFELVADEKWIDEKGGRELLEKTGLYARLNILPVSDPLMLAINPRFIHESEQTHLIVENKTTYQGLLPVLKQTRFATLIYGCGKAVIKSIEQFSMQYPVRAAHRFLYFGDLDREGLSIWYSLNQKQAAEPALPFYEACLKKKAAAGKAYQQARSTAIDAFLTHFPAPEAQQIQRALQNGNYYPQEILKTKELQQIGREADWKN